MRDAIRCCISCILPCGALDVIRIVHVNGRVEEISGTIYAAEIMKAHPKHILKKPTTKPISEDMDHHHRPAIVVVPPDAQLQRGKIYFLIPVMSDSSKKNNSKSSKKSAQLVVSADGSARKIKRELQKSGSRNHGNNNHSDSYNNNVYNNNNNNNGTSKDDDKYLSEILSEKVSSNKDRRRGRVAVWRPHLESITETLSDAASSDQ